MPRWRSSFLSAARPSETLDFCLEETPRQHENFFSMLDRGLMYSLGVGFLPEDNPETCSRLQAPVVSVLVAEWLYCDWNGIKFLQSIHHNYYWVPESLCTREKIRPIVSPMCRVVQDVVGFCKSCCLCCIALLLKVLYLSGRFTFFLPACQFPQFWHCEALFTEPLVYVSSCMTPYMRKAAEEECGLWVIFCKSSMPDWVPHPGSAMLYISRRRRLLLLSCLAVKMAFLWAYCAFDRVFISCVAVPLKELLKPLPKSSQTGRSLPSGEICLENTSSSVFCQN